MTEKEATDIFVVELKRFGINVNPKVHKEVMHEIAYMVAVSFCLANELL